MDKNEQEFLKHLREIFRLEAEDHLHNLSAGLIELENTTEPVETAKIVENIFREAHSLKGAARSVNLKEIESICQPLESIFAALKCQEVVLSTPLFDLLHQALDGLTQLVSTMNSEKTSSEKAILNKLSNRLSEVAHGDTPSNLKNTALSVSKKSISSQEGSQPLKSAKSVAAKKNPDVPMIEVAKGSELDIEKTVDTWNREITAQSIAETVRIPISKLDPMLQQAEEMIQVKISGDHRMDDLKEISATISSLKRDLAKWKKDRALQGNGLPEWVDDHLEVLSGQVDSVSQIFKQDQIVLRSMLDEHLDSIRQVLMLPVSTLLEIFPKLVRDLARDQNKEIDLVIRDADIEIDKRILEELKDPLIHLLRNCVDHGIEKPEVRARQGKPERGVITIAFNAKGSQEIEIQVSDDGAGINLERVRKVAIQSSSISKDQAGMMDEQKTLQLIFESGISTSDIITDISGRGLGLAIVREKVEKLRGQISVESMAGFGTCFRLLLPMKLAIFRGVLVRASSQEFIIPTTHVERVVRISTDDIQTVENHRTIQLDGQILSLVRLSDVLNLPHINKSISDKGFEGAKMFMSYSIRVLILVAVEKRIAFQVDEIVEEIEVLVKGLGNQLRRVRNIAGCTILGAGTVVSVLNIVDLINSVVHPDAIVEKPVEDENHVESRSHILVAEDSITSRTLIKSILESSGYQVITAVDGVDAFTKLHSSDFDLVVSDVDMPRMSGFELTTKIRADKKISELPIVLVTALESNQDREHGIEVGANAYIVKSSFDQSNLLEVVHRLI